MLLNDEQFQQQFEQLTLSPQYFNHLGHLRISWIYLSQMDLKKAIVRVTHGIKAYANSLGATEKFHHTLTEASVRIIHQRMQQSGNCSFETFLQKNSDLVDNLNGVIHTLYSPGALNSNQAKRTFIRPDLQQFD